MNPFNKLTDEDQGLIEQYIKWYGPIYPDSVNWNRWTSVKNVLSTWNQEKKTLFKLFGEELIVRRPYTYKYNIEGLSREIMTAMNNDKPFQDFRGWWEYSVKHYANARFELIDNVDHGMFYSKFYLIEQAFDSKTLAENAYNGSEYKIKFEDGTIFKVSTGMKPMKILHKFIEKYGNPEAEEMFERFRIWHSKLLNQKAVDGELCLSIHPLDYMTMSDNDSNWSSCMRWTDKHGNADAGDYRAGTIDCLNSPYIIVAYLHNKNHTFKLEDAWEWNNKRWRELFIINEGCITEIKGYPYQDENLTNTCLMWIKELANNNLNWTYEDEEVNMKESAPLEDGHNLYFDFLKSPYMYKDIGSLQKHAGRINKKVLLDKNKFGRWSPFRRDNQEEVDFFVEIPYGGEPTCMCCGGAIDEDGRERSVLCDWCDSVRTCACCGNVIYSDDDCYWTEDSDYPMCYDCWSDQTCIDDLTEESHLTDNMTEIYLLKGYDEEKNPVFSSYRHIMVYEPEDNWEFQRIFTGPPKYIDYRYCVSIDMVNPEYSRTFYNVFDISAEDLYDDIYYLPNMELAYPEDEV